MIESYDLCQKFNNKTVINNIKLNIDEIELPQVDNTRNLGVEMDASLFCHDHISEKIKKLFLNSTLYIHRDNFFNIDTKKMVFDSRRIHFMQNFCFHYSSCGIHREYPVSKT